VKYAAYICAPGCMAECRHHEACVVYWVDRDHPHPVKRGREQHFAMDNAGMMHEWNGEAGKCRIYDPAEEEENQVLPLHLSPLGQPDP
jgi:hypothetical protein